MFVHRDPFEVRVPGSSLIAHAEADAGAAGGAPAAGGGDDEEKPITQKALNAALAAERRRADKAQEKFTSDFWAKLDEKFKGLQPQPAADAKAGDGKTGDKKTDDGKAEDPDEQKRSNKTRIEALEKQLAEERAAREASDKQRKQQAIDNAKDRQRQALISQLEAKGVKGAKARALVRDMELEGQLKFDAEAKARLLVKRSRIEGEPAELQEFDDLEAGVADWVKTKAAEEWLPAPAPEKKPTPKPRATTVPQPSAPAQGRALDASEDELIDSVINRIGADKVAAAFNE